MPRTRQAYAGKFRTLLRRCGARRPEQGVRWLLVEAEQFAQREHESLTRALIRIYVATLRKVGHADESSVSAPARFLCDAGLGGLARWLRAAGYTADWSPEIGDDELVRRARYAGIVALTTNSLLLERREIRDGQVPCVWVPPSLKPLEQLELIFHELDLSLRASLCMNCGGSLRPVDKESVRDRIPPRTWRWLNEYSLCERCGQLFWHGTHWQNIQCRLGRLHADRKSG